MPFELLYVARSGSHRYWTTHHSLSTKKDDHVQWASETALRTDFAKLMTDFPTIFQSKNRQRFAILDTVTKQTESVSVPSSSNTTIPESTNSAFVVAIPKSRKRKMKKDGKQFVVATIIGQTCYFLDTTRNTNGDFVPTLNPQVKRWEDASKATQTAILLHNNQRFWQECSVNPHRFICVLDAQNEKIVWSSHELSIADNPAQTTITKLDKLNSQLNGHFKSDQNESIIVSKVVTTALPTLDLHGITAIKVFNALEYIITALTYRDQVNEVVNYYDQRIVQDILHTAELVDLGKLDAVAFVKYLQKTRRTRRKFKDLSVILNCLAENTDSQAIIDQLLAHPSLHNRYVYRDQQTATAMQAAINPDADTKAPLTAN